VYELLLKYNKFAVISVVALHRIRYVTPLTIGVGDRIILKMQGYGFA